MASILDRHADKWTPTAYGCWIWTGAVSGSGQPRAIVGIPRIEAGVKQKIASVARLICEETYGPPPSSKYHAAHNTPNGCLGFICVNPAHIRWATPKENQQDIPREIMLERCRRATFAHYGVKDNGR